MVTHSKYICTKFIKENKPINYDKTHYLVSLNCKVGDLKYHRNDTQRAQVRSEKNTCKSFSDLCEQVRDVFPSARNETGFVFANLHK